MADFSIHKACAAFAVCLLHLRRLADSLKPYPWWTDNPPDPQRVEKAIQEIHPQLMESFSRLQECQGNATRELREAHKRMLERGVAVSQVPAKALGTSGRFYLDIACKKVKEAVKCVEHALFDTKDLAPLPDGTPLPKGNPIDWLRRLEDTTSEEWTWFINALSMEVSVAADELQRPGSPKDGKDGEMAIDDSAFVTAKSLWQEKFNNYKAAKKFLDTHPEIHTRKPGKQLLEIHAGDWAKYWSKQDSQGFDALDNAATPEITSVVVEGMKGRYEQQHAAKQRQQPQGNAPIDALAKRIQAGK